jgi:hypothetical protein
MINYTRIIYAVLVSFLIYFHIVIIIFPFMYRFPFIPFTLMNHFKQRSRVVLLEDFPWASPGNIRVRRYRFRCNGTPMHSPLHGHPQTKGQTRKVQDGHDKYKTGTTTTGQNTKSTGRRKKILSPI